MINEWTLYWLTRLDGIQVILVITAIVSIMGTVFIWVNSCIEYDADELWIKRGLSALISLVFWAAVVLVPNTKEALIIWGVPKLLNSQKAAITEAGEVPTKVLKLFNQYLDEKLIEQKGATNQ